MNTWLTIALVLAGCIAAILLLALLMAAILLSAGKRHYNKVRAELAAEIRARLPRTDCGACGEATCAAYAQGWAETERCPGQCPFLTDEDREEIDEILRAQRAVEAAARKNGGADQG